VAFWGLYGACFGSFGLLALVGRGLSWFCVLCFVGGGQLCNTASTTQLVLRGGQLCNTPVFY